MRYKILVIQEHHDNRETLGALLKRSGLKVIAAGNGEEGYYKTRDEKPDLIITDLMPDMNPYDLIRQFRELPEMEAVPILIYTAYNLENKRIAKEAGATEVFYKPEGSDDLISYAVHFFDKKA